jgi:hypothetical protein
MICSLKTKEEEEEKEEEGRDDDDDVDSTASTGLDDAVITIVKTITNHHDTTEAQVCIKVMLICCSYSHYYKLT